MSRLSHLATAPLRAATRLRRRGSATWPRLPRRSVSVGNLALGGRCKTPMVAALVAHATERGLHPAVLSRGYPVMSRQRTPRVLTAEAASSGPSWLTLLACRGPSELITAPAYELAARVGDEPSWLAAITGAPVGVHPNRVAAAHEVLRLHPETDLFVLDDGLQTAVRADVDVVMVDASLDLTGRAALRENASSLVDALVVTVGSAVTRAPGRLLDLRTGQECAPPDTPMALAAAVGTPESVAQLARESGLTLGSSIRLRDHRGPSMRRLARHRGPLLVTEKDAVGWAYASGRQGLVIELRLDGARAVCEAAMVWGGGSA